MPLQKETILIFEILNTPFAVSTEEGEKLFKIINEYFLAEKEVILDFDKIELIVSTFLNAAVGQLYGKYTTEFIQTHLTIYNMSVDDLIILKKVTDRAKEYFEDKDGFERVFKKHFPDGE